MSRLANDISRCPSGDDCPLGKTCLRWLDKGDETRQVFSAFTPSIGCQSYIPVRESEA